MEHLPKVSYVVTSLNQGRFLRSTLDSLIEQDYPELEIILVDGGSTDNSLDIIKEYSPKLKWWVSEPDRSPEHAINKGMAHAIGKYVNFLPSDDILTPGALHKTVNFLESHPEVDGVFGNSRLIDPDGQLIVDRYDIPFDRHVVLYAFNYMAQATGLFKRETICRLGGIREDISFPSDMEWWLRMDKAGCKFGFIQDILAEFRCHSSSNCTSFLNTASSDFASQLLALKREYGWSCNSGLMSNIVYFVLGIHFRAVRKLRQIRMYGRTNFLPASIGIRRRLRTFDA